MRQTLLWMHASDMYRAMRVVKSYNSPFAFVL